MLEGSTSNFDDEVTFIKDALNKNVMTSVIYNEPKVLVNIHKIDAESKNPMKERTSFWIYCCIKSKRKDNTSNNPMSGNSATQNSGFSGKVYSIFPQDNILGTESGSEFVLNYKSLGVKLDESPVYVIDTNKEISTNISKNYEEEGMFTGDITKVLIPIIKRIKSVNKKAIPETPGSFVSYLQEAFKAYFPDFTLTPYVDAQTGIKSLNHYVLGVYDE